MVAVPYKGVPTATMPARLPLGSVSFDSTFNSKETGLIVPLGSTENGQAIRSSTAIGGNSVLGTTCTITSAVSVLPLGSVIW